MTMSVLLLVGEVSIKIEPNPYGPERKHIASDTFPTTISEYGVGRLIHDRSKDAEDSHENGQPAH